MKNLLFFLFCIITGLNNQIIAQNKTPILKISYVEDINDPKTMEILKSTMTPAKYNDIVARLNRTRFYYSLYINPHTNEAFLVQDSLTWKKDISIPGYIYAIFKDSENKYKHCEFLGKDVYYESISDDYKWEIGTQTKKIADMQATSATLTDDPDKESKVWITTNIPASVGPSYYQNAPGLILEAESTFGNFKAVKIEYLKDDTEMETKKKKALDDFAHQKFEPVKKIFDNKKLLVNMLLNQLKTILHKRATE